MTYELINLSVGLGCLWLDYLIYKYVRMEYIESKELNKLLCKSYKKSKRRKLDATKLIKGILANESTEVSTPE